MTADPLPRSSLSGVRAEAEEWRPPADSLALIDAVRSKIKPDDPALAPWYENYCREHRSRLAADVHAVTQHVPAGARIIEYGAVPLLTTAALAELGYAVQALDVAPARFESAIESLGLDVRKSDIETQPAPFADESFDAALFNELFEHLRINPIATFREVRRVLRVDGLLLLSTPNLRSLRGIRNLLWHNQAHAASAGVYQQYEKLETVGHMGHVREYTTREVADFLTQAGFGVEKVLYRGGHGRGAVGLIERAAPQLRPFFSIIARKRAPDG